MPKPAFVRVLVAFDGSETAAAALSWALAISAAGSELIIVNVVDELMIMAEATNAGPVAFAPEMLLEELEAHGRSLLDAAKKLAQAARIEPVLEIARDSPVAAIVETAQKRSCDLIVMGTHARTGLSRLFLGSTTEGVLRASEIPVLTVRHALEHGNAPIHRFLVAVDDSDPAGAALLLAKRLVADAAGELIVCNVADTVRTDQMATMYGYDPAQFIAEQCSVARSLVERAALLAGLRPGSFELAVVHGKAAAALAAAASDRHADLIVIGSHGRRGLQRLALGSVADHVVRSSPVPVLVVRK